MWSGTPMINCTMNSVKGLSCQEVRSITTIPLWVQISSSFIVGVEGATELHRRAALGRSYQFEQCGSGRWHRQQRLACSTTGTPQTAVSRGKASRMAQRPLCGGYREWPAGGDRQQPLQSRRPGGHEERPLWAEMRLLTERKDRKVAESCGWREMGGSCKHLSATFRRGLTGVSRYLLAGN